MLSDELFKYHQIQDRNEVYPVSSRPLVQVCETEEIPERGFEIGRHYNLHVQLGTRFKCPEAGYKEALHQAKRSMLYKIYAPIIADLQEIRQAAESQDTRDIILICNRIENEITKGVQR